MPRQFSYQSSFSLCRRLLGFLFSVFLLLNMALKPLSFSREVMVRSLNLVLGFGGISEDVDVEPLHTFCGSCKSTLSLHMKATNLTLQNINYSNYSTAFYGQLNCLLYFYFSPDTSNYRSLSCFLYRIYA